MTTLAIALSAAVVAGAGTAVAGHAAFTDGPFGVHEAGVHFVGERGVTTGCTSTAYCPDRPVTRAQMATFLHRLSGHAEGVAPSVDAEAVDGRTVGDLMSATVLVVEAEIAGGVGYAACPSGAFAVGGGFAQDEGQRSIPVVDAAYHDPQAAQDLWVVGLEDPATGVFAGTGVVQANCVLPASLVEPGPQAMASAGPPDHERAARLVRDMRAR